MPILFGGAGDCFWSEKLKHSTEFLRKLFYSKFLTKSDQKLETEPKVATILQFPTTFSPFYSHTPPLIR